MKIKQINNITIKQHWLGNMVRRFRCCVDGKVLEEFDTLPEAEAWASQTFDFVSHKTVGKDPRWKQANPADQMLCILMSMEGWISCLETGFSNAGTVTEKMKEHHKQLKELEPFLRNPETW